MGALAGGGTGEALAVEGAGESKTDDDCGDAKGSMSRPTLISTFVKRRRFAVGAWRITVSGLSSISFAMTQLGIDAIYGVKRIIHMSKGVGRVKIVGIVFRGRLLLKTEPVGIMFSVDIYATYQTSAELTATNIPVDGDRPSVSGRRLWVPGLMCSVLGLPLSVFGIMCSVLFLRSSAFDLMSRVLGIQSTVFALRSSAFGIRSSV